MHLRTINLGLDMDWAKPAKGVVQTHTFFARANGILEDCGLAVRTRRLTTQPLTLRELDSDGPAHPGLVTKLRELDESLGDVWACVPGHRLGWGSSASNDFSYVSELLSGTESIFCNVMVSTEEGLNLRATHEGARVVQELARRIPLGVGNFRFGVLTNTAPSTPFFPAAYHEGPPGFTVALELGAFAREAFDGDGDFNVRLEAFAANVTAQAREVAQVALGIEQDTGVQFLGMDLSLAAFPGEQHSVVGALEALNGAPAGSASFLVTLNAVNRVLKTVADDVPRVGYNGTMFSVLEDTVLARRVAEGKVTTKDLLLFSTLCGCGLDMLPVPLDASVEQLAALIQAISIIGHQWRKPLLARLVPCPVNAEGMTCFEHPFLVNTTPLKAEDLSFAVPHAYEGIIPGRTSTTGQRASTTRSVVVSRMFSVDSTEGVAQ